MIVKVEHSDIVHLIKKDELGSGGLGDLLSEYAAHQKAKGYEVSEIEIFAKRLARGECDCQWVGPQIDKKSNWSLSLKRMNELREQAATPMQFKHLNVGNTFHFKSGIKSGMCEKTSARKYRYCDETEEQSIGSILVEVVRVERPITQKEYDEEIVKEKPFQSKK